jgi:hypothetical protein
MKSSQFPFRQTQRVTLFFISCPQNEKRLCADEAVAGQSLTALDTLQQKGVIATGYLEVSGHWSFQISLNITADWYQIAVLS